MVIFLIPKEIKKIIHKIEDNGFEAYLVGGFVRDALLLKTTNDIDLATNAKPKDLIQIFGPSKKENEYGSYHLKVDNYTIDITTYRKEISYENGKLNKVEYTTNLLEDASRRDFTVNALYMNKEENIIDLYNGRIDLMNKKLKMIGNPYLRLKEDPTRILRAVRFATQYKLRMDKELYHAILKEKKNLQNISESKIRQELDKILLANGFDVLKKLGLLKELEIESQKIVYVEDLSGLWAQIKTSKNYVVEKELKIRQKMIADQIKCGTIKVLHLYKYGYYQCLVVARIIHFPLKKLEKMVKELPITSRRDIALTTEEMAALSGKQGKELGILLEDIEEKIVTRKIKNDEESIKKYIKERG